MQAKMLMYMESADGIEAHRDEFAVKSSIIGAWAVLIVVVFFYALQAYPHTTGIDFFSTALGALFGAWLIGALLFVIIGAVYKVISGNKLPGFKVVVPMVATGMVITTLIVMY